jgi:hypothetical protein
MRGLLQKAIGACVRRDELTRLDARAAAQSQLCWSKIKHCLLKKYSMNCVRFKIRKIQLQISVYIRSSNLNLWQLIKGPSGNEYFTRRQSASNIMRCQ